MTKKGHLLFTSNAMGAFLILSGYNIHNIPTHFIPLFPSIIFGLYLGSLLPDIDDPRSYIGRIFTPLAYGFHVALGHRGLIHSFMFSILIGLLSLFCPMYSFGFYFFIACGIGCLLHDIADMLTDGGIKGFFFPFFRENRIVLLPSFLRIKTNTVSEYLFFIPMFFLLGFFILVFLQKI